MRKILFVLYIFLISIVLVTNLKGIGAARYGSNSTMHRESKAIPSSEKVLININRFILNFGELTDRFLAPSQHFIISSSGGGTLNWTIKTNQKWINCKPDFGTNSGTVSVSIDSSGLSSGIYNGTIEVSDPNASNSPQKINVTLNVYDEGESNPAFGYFETPVNGSIVRSSISVSGWVLDDIGVEYVKICWQSDCAPEYSGYALLVEGARPDVEQAYPDYPLNYKAGWGYMLLTNFLPKGDGSYTLSIRAKDVEGNEVCLGTKAIHVDNAHAVKPFGAIDKPKQGGTADGSSFRNHGWVLTPMPNSIPMDGSTINVYLDGIDIGHPTYNIFRSDIAALFPGYANKDGAGGYFDIDTTTYANGIHTIYWIAQDTAGNTDGIGSRFFTIQNSGGNRVKNTSTHVVKFDLLQLSKLPVDFTNPIRVKQGYGKHIKPRIITPNDRGIARINIKELERIEIQLANMGSEVTGYVIAGEKFRPLPIGSSIKNGVFYWTPVPGFFGEYRLLFVVKGLDGDLNKREVVVRIDPKFGLKE